MTINRIICNFSKLINFIRSIDGDLHNIEDFYIIDKIYDDSWDYNEDELANSMYSGFNDILKIIRNALIDDTPNNTSITIEDNEYLNDTINVWMKIDNNDSYVMSISKSIYEEKINNWLALNAKPIVINV